MNPETTTSISLDYLIELSDDGNDPREAEAGEIVIPPVLPPVGSAPPAAGAVEQSAQLR